ncbi:MAG: tetratricopeptide repeat protein [Verrucomicrobia bacterium]|nr:tetratricopeptide repeat protein [Verrucomicrobiota bacterium]
MKLCDGLRWAAAAAVAAGLAGCVTGSTPPRRAADRGDRGQPLGAREGAAEQTLEARVQTHAHFAMGIVNDLNGEQDRALEEFRLAAEADPGNELLVSDVARRLLQNRQPKKAADLLARAVERPRASGQLYTLLGVAEAEAGRWDQAMQANRIAIRKLPGSLAAYRTQVRCYLQGRKPKLRKAAALLVSAARRRSPDPTFLVEVAGLYGACSAQLGKHAVWVKPRIVKALDRAARLQPKNADLRQKLADGYSMLGEFAKARSIYAGLLQRDPHLPGVREKLADLCLQMGDKKGAQEQLESLLRDNPTNPNLYYLLGTILADEKEYEAAVENYEKTVLLNPDAERVYYDLAGLKITLNKPEEALRVLDKARGRFKQSFWMEFYAGLAYSRLKQYPEALRRFTAAEVVGAATDPKRLDSIFYFQMAAAYERSKEYTQAEKYFQKCLTLSPDNVEAMNYLGYMWADHGVNLDKARTLIEKAVRSEPDNAAFLDSLGWVLFKLNQPHEALAQVLKAIQHSQEPDAVLYDHLGDIYAGLRQYEQARAAWRKSLSVEPSAEVEQKLKTAPSTELLPR